MNIHVKLTYEFDVNVDDQLEMSSKEGLPTLCIKYDCEEWCKRLFVAPINKYARQILPMNYTQS